MASSRWDSVLDSAIAQPVTPPMGSRERSTETSPSLKRFRDITRRNLILHKQRHLGVDSQNMKLGKFGGDSLLIHNADSAMLRQHTLPDEDPEADGMKLAAPKDGANNFVPLSDEDLTRTCHTVAKMLYSGKFQSSNETDKIEPYMREVFQRLSTDKYKSVCEGAKRGAEKGTDFTLTCKVLGAKDLISKDSDGLSDPYCVMGILHRRHLDDKLVKKGNLHDWLEPGMVKTVVQSTAKEKTLEPEWNESFELIVKNPHDEYLVIEIWDSDTPDKARYKVKGLHGLANFFRDMKREDDFMGRAFHLLQNITSMASEHVLDLTSHSTNSKRGTVTVQLVMIPGGELTQRECYYEHRRIVVAVFDHESSAGKDSYIRGWSGVISSMGQAILKQHAMLKLISPLQEAAIQMSVLMNYHKSYTVEMPAFRQLLIVIAKNDSELQKMKAEADAGPGPDNYWVVELFIHLKELASYIIDLMKIHLDVFDVKCKKGIERLRNHLLTFQDLYAIQSFTSQLTPDQKDYHSVLSQCIQTSVPQWFLITTANNMPGSTDEETKMLSFKALCNHCLNQSTRAHDSIHPVFMEVGVDYFSIFFVSFEKLFHAEADRALNVKSDELILTTFELYRIFQCFMPLTQKVSKKHLEQLGTNLHILCYHNWFKSYVSDWLRIAINRAKERILKSIEIDKVVKVTDQVPFSSSVVDTNTTFLQVIAFWKDLQWPDREQSHEWFVSVVKGLCELTLYYTDILYHKLKEEDLTNRGGLFHITDKLCVTFNNIKHIEEVLVNIHEEMDLPTFFKWLDEEQLASAVDQQRKEDQSVVPSLSKRSQTLMDDQVLSACEDVRHKLQLMVDNIRNRLIPWVIKSFPDITQDSISDEAILRMIEYMKNNLLQLSTALLSQLFQGILGDLWHDVLVALRKKYDELSHKQSARQCYTNLLELIAVLRDFFHSGGGGLTGDDLQTEEYMTLVEIVQIGRAKTESVIRQFLVNLVQQQEEAENKYGLLNLSHSYSSKSRVLTVFLANAINLPALDKNGSSDPFVEALVLSTQQKSLHKTSAVHKSTLNPVFNEELKISIEREELKSPESVLLLAVFDHDTIGSNDFAGLCVVKCLSIPVIEQEERKTEHLNLFHFKETLAYRELTLRSDSAAVDFCKFMKRFRSPLESSVSPKIAQKFLDTFRR